MTNTKYRGSVLLHAPAKINLYLHITGQRADGYHTLDTGIVFTEFGDRISVESGEADEISLTGPFAKDLESIDVCKNICAFALNAYRQFGGEFAPLKLIVEKNIPVGGGLGGGSANAAALLRYLNQNSKKPLSADLLYGLALDLGADVPVCLNMEPSRVSGIGDRLSPLNIKKTGPILLANPGNALATGDAFRVFAENEKIKFRPLTKPINRWMSAKGLVKLGNDLEKTACMIMPKIRDLMIEMQNQDGAIGVGLSGSGATCFALYENDLKCKAGAATLQSQGTWAVATKIIQEKI
jgi:4-diphosphocytidyl-2-C-methyl-D-erythritol kinase